MRAPERIIATRIVAAPAALDAVAWPLDTLALRIAPDEMLIVGEANLPGIDDPHAIIVPDTGWAGLWLSAPEAMEVLARTCEWEPPAARPAFAQGMVAGLPIKLWLEEERVLFLAPAPFAADLEERLA